MKMIKNLSKRNKGRLIKGSLGLSLLLASSLSFAVDNNGDIIQTLIQGSIGKTLSKDGHLWTMLIAVTFAVGGFWAAVKSDPKAFIPAFVVMGLITTVTGVFLSF
jgi:hypothetical protein